MRFNGNLLLEDGAIKTISELIVAAMTARTYESARSKTDAVNRMNPAIVAEGFIKPTGQAIYSIDAFKGVRNGVADSTVWNAGDFTALPGGGETLEADISRHFNGGEDLASTVLYNGSGVDVTIYVDLFTA